MTLEKAIEVAQDIIHYVDPGDPPEEHNALKLLIEAGKRLQDMREDPRGIWVMPLPGETED